jgi:hypothetical protein
MLQRPRRNRKVLNQQSEHVFLQNGHATTTSILPAWAATSVVFVCPFWAVWNELKRKAVTKSPPPTPMANNDHWLGSLASHIVHAMQLFSFVWSAKTLICVRSFLELHISPHTLLHFVQHPHTSSRAHPH